MMRKGLQGQNDEDGMMRTESQDRDSPSRALGRVNTVIYEANDTKNVSLTHEKYRYDTTVNRRYKTIFFWCYNTHGMPQF